MTEGEASSPLRQGVSGFGAVECDLVLAMPVTVMLADPLDSIIIWIGVNDVMLYG